MSGRRPMAGLPAAGLLAAGLLAAGMAAPLSGCGPDAEPAGRAVAAPETAGQTASGKGAGSSSSGGRESRARASAAAPVRPQADFTPTADVFDFVEVAAESGLDFRHVSGSPDKRQIYEANSGGVAWLDYDGDGDMDLYLVNGAHRLTAAPPPDSEWTSGALYENRDGRFVDVTRQAGLRDWRWGMGVAVADYDNDGDPDIYVTLLAPNALWRNNGDGTFTDVAAAAGVAEPGPGSGAAFGDIDGDGWLDLYVSNYIPVQPDIPLPSNEELCIFRGVPVFCGPKGLPPAPDALFKSNGDGTFSDVTDSSGIGAVSPRYSFDVLFLDVDDDGDADIYVAADDSPSLLFVNDGTGTFRDEGLMAGVALSEAGLSQAGMGLDAADYDGDGLQDIVKTNFETEPFNLYRNSGRALFSDRAFHAGLSGSVAPLGFGTVFLDADRDGLLDLFFANGHVYPWLAPEPGPYEYAQRNQMLKGERVGDAIRFRDVTAASGPAFAARKVSRGVAVADYDGDGDLDLAVNNMDDAPDLLRNDTPPAGGWLSLRLRGTRSSRDAYGARVTLIGSRGRQTAEVRASRGYLSSSDPAVFFGLGSDPGPFTVEVRWPAGGRERFRPAGVNRRLELVEGTGLAPR